MLVRHASSASLRLIRSSFLLSTSASVITGLGSEWLGPPCSSISKTPTSFAFRYVNPSRSLSLSCSASASSSMAPNTSEYVFPNDQPVVTLDAKKAFEALSKQQQLYAHYLSRASFYGGLIVLIQTSPESANIYRLLQKINGAESVDDLKKAALAAGVSEEDFKAYLVYCSALYSNMGNYKGFGDSKFVPNLSVETFGKIINASAAFKADSASVGALWESLKGPIYILDNKTKQLGLGDKGVSTYFSENCDLADSDKINRFFKANHIEGYINRAFKTEANGKVKYEIRNAAVENKVLNTIEFEGAIFEITTGDYQPLLQKVVENLGLARNYAANEEEKAMLTDYMKSFQEGSLEAHKDGSRHWIKDKGPIVESYIGFIETYRDPVGMRGEFEGFVSMVNKEQSAKFQSLVDNAVNLLEKLPWPKGFEKDKFLKPDFTSLDVLTFAGSGVPAGINIPNYDEIRQSEGFKNVNLGNVIASSYKTDQKTTFVSDEDHELLKKWKVPSFEVQVGLHELLGHGSGKLLRKEVNGSFNFDPSLVDPLTEKPVSHFYEHGETYDSKFTSLGSSYEECRAECVGLYLSCDPLPMHIFGHEGKEAEDVTYVNWLSLCLAAVKGVEMWSPASRQWKQAHSQARFVILHVLLEAGNGFLKLNQTVGEDGKPDLLLTMDRTKLQTVGKDAIGNFLKKLQVYKSTGDIEEATKMYDHFSEVRDDGPFPFAKWRDIVVARKTPRKILVQANTVIKDEQLSLVEYESSPSGMVKAWVERFSGDEHKQIDQWLDELVKRDAPYFKNQ